MARFIPDINSRRWVVIAPRRAMRPGEPMATKEEKETCPFCEGNEYLTPKEVYRFGGEGNWNKPGWRVRVVPNRFPITDIHEVIIHSPSHTKEIEDLSGEQVVLILNILRQRYQEHRERGQVLIFNNHGREAGASLRHPHSQLVVVPNQIKLDVLAREPVRNLVLDNHFFVAYCPDFSQWPYEVWIAPKKNPGEACEVNGEVGCELSEENFGDISREAIEALATLLKRILRVLVDKFDVDPEDPYNFYISPGGDWYLRIIPRLIERAGFELGTGLHVNICDPEKAARELRGSLPKLRG
jgi:UDPglucose--hexose-1-phosphate uridylyltransferase